MKIFVRLLHQLHGRNRLDGRSHYQSLELAYHALDGWAARHTPTDQAHTLRPLADYAQALETAGGVEDVIYDGGGTRLVLHLKTVA